MEHIQYSGKFDFPASIEETDYQIVSTTTPQPVAKRCSEHPSVKNKLRHANSVVQRYKGQANGAKKRMQVSYFCRFLFRYAVSFNSSRIVNGKTHGYV